MRKRQNSTDQMNFTDKAVKVQELILGDSVRKCDLKKKMLFWIIDGHKKEKI